MSRECARATAASRSFQRRGNARPFGFRHVRRVGAVAVDQLPHQLFHPTGAAQSRASPCGNFRRVRWRTASLTKVAPTARLARLGGGRTRALAEVVPTAGFAELSICRVRRGQSGRRRGGFKRWRDRGLSPTQGQANGDRQPDQRRQDCRAAPSGHGSHPPTFNQPYYTLHLARAFHDNLTEDVAPRHHGRSSIASFPHSSVEKLSCSLTQPPINRLNTEPGGKMAVTSRMGLWGGYHGSYRTRCPHAFLCSVCGGYGYHDRGIAHGAAVRGDAGPRVWIQYPSAKLRICHPPPESCPSFRITPGALFAST